MDASLTHFVGPRRRSRPRLFESIEVYQQFRARRLCLVRVKTGKARCEHMFSALPLRADIAQCSRHVRFVPEAAISPTAKTPGRTLTAGCTVNYRPYLGAPACYRLN